MAIWENMSEDQAIAAAKKDAARKAAARMAQQPREDFLAEEEAQKEAARLGMVEAAERAPLELRHRMGQLERAGAQEAIHARQLAAAGLGRAMPFSGAGGAAARAGLGSALQTAAQIGQRQATGLERLAGLGVEAAGLEMQAGQTAIEMAKSSEQQAKLANYMSIYNEALDKQGHDGARAAVNSLLSTETDPAVRESVGIFLSIQGLF